MDRLHYRYHPLEPCLVRYYIPFNIRVAGMSISQAGRQLVRHIRNDELQYRPYAVWHHFYRDRTICDTSQRVRDEVVEDPVPRSRDDMKICDDGSSYALVDIHVYTYTRIMYIHSRHCRAIPNSLSLSPSRASLRDLSSSLTCYSLSCRISSPRAALSSPASSPHDALSSCVCSFRLWHHVLLVHVPHLLAPEYVAPQH